MAPDDHADLILLQELVNYVRSVSHYVILLLRIPHCVRLHALNVIRCCRITPHDVHTHLLNRVSDGAERDPQWPLNLVNILQLDDRVANASMNTQYAILVLLLEKSSKGHPLEQVVNLLEN